MKTLILLLLLSFQMMYAQENISFTVLQDARLLVSDDDHGNKAPTLDYTLAMDWEGKQYTYYYFSVRAEFEYADLIGGYYLKYGVATMWNFNQLFVPKLTAHIGTGIGVIHRDAGGLGTYFIIGELSYPVFKSLRVVINSEIIRRSDLEVPLNRFNGNIGLRISI